MCVGWGGVGVVVGGGGLYNYLDFTRNLCFFFFKGMSVLR